MEENELISVVITTHGRSDRIENAIKSVMKQTYKNIEIIVVDDNSDDLEERKRTEKIAKQYKEVRLVENKTNLGGAESRNAGITKSRGSLISFLDDDDQYLPERIEKLYKIFLEHKKDNIGLAYCSCSVVNNNGRIIGEFVNVANGQPFYQQMMGCVAGTSMWLAPKKVLNSVGNFDDVPSKQDSTVILKMLIAGYNVFGTSEKLVLYYEHCGNGISGTKPSNAEGIRKYREKCREQYDRVTKTEIANIECNFSRHLITNYVVNNNAIGAKKELRNIWKYKPFSRIYFKNMIKIMCRRKYLDRLERIKEERK